MEKMDEKKEAVPQPPVSTPVQSLAQSTHLPEDAKTEELKEKEQPVSSIEEKASELAQENELSSSVNKHAGNDQVSTSDDKSDGQKDQPVPEGSSADRDRESEMKIGVGSVGKEKDGKDDVVSPTGSEKSDKNVMGKVDQGVAEMKLTEQSDGVDTSKTIDEEKSSVINETTDISKSEEYSNHTEKTDSEVIDKVQMDVDPPPPVQEQVQSEVNISEEEKIPVKDEDGSRHEEEIYKSDDWDFPPSDSEDGNFFSEPPPHVIIELYEKLAKEDVLDLEWTCLGRRTPEEEMQEMEVEDASKDSQEEMVNKPVEEDPTEFDFDIDTMMQNKVTPRRMAVFDQGGSGSAKKRVAQMDNVINDLRRFSKINEEMVKTGAGAEPALSDLEVTPQRPLGKFHIRRDLHQ